MIHLTWRRFCMQQNCQNWLDLKFRTVIVFVMIHLIWRRFIMILPFLDLFSSKNAQICLNFNESTLHTLRAFIKRMIKMLLHCTLHSGQKYPKCLINILRYKLP